MFNLATRVVGFAALTGAALAMSSAAFAQDARDIAGGRVPCPNPVVINLSAGPGALNAIPGELPPDWNAYKGKKATSFGQTGYDTIFAHTMRWELRKGLCCEVKGKVYVTLKSQSAADNDSVGIGFGSNPVIAHKPLTASAAGQVKTVDFDLPANAIAGGHITVWAQDDHSIENIRVELRGCCVQPLVQTH